ncbi:TetR/AcrR family transcriptional regulator [Nocardia pseudobrasiliensis]|uniref:TetR family transcriptional regulator n=1 Tax=Nocardia pseudobrasiliensis TaxID=45979 RepID=A0A370IBK0_9NOCA|nr:TetR/AcrR family transcriptional regulator [Nocardia pseudobrasiliensis]RDI68073.1 TetR family transcriptional regulator [Nocardia pseudobrasiliensis]
MAVRRTQEQRSAATQTKVMDATIECLREYGYRGTTTLLVAERAGVTRGALLHHYRSREDLVAAAVRYLAVKRVREALETFGRLTLSEDVVPQALDLLWRMHQGPVFAAVLELWVAARTDDVLAGQVESGRTARCANTFRARATRSADRAHHGAAGRAALSGRAGPDSAGLGALSAAR